MQNLLQPKLEAKPRKEPKPPAEVREEFPSVGSTLPSLGGELPSLGGGSKAGLGGVGFRQGAFEVDPELKRKAMAEMRKLNAQFDEVDLGEDDAAVDTRTLAEIIKEKRLKQEQAIEEAKAKQETVEERKARLAA